MKQFGTVKSKWPIEDQSVYSESVHMIETLEFINWTRFALSNNGLNVVYYLQELSTDSTLQNEHNICLVMGHTLENLSSNSFQSNAVDSHRAYSFQFTAVDSNQCTAFCTKDVHSIQCTTVISFQSTALDSKHAYSFQFTAVDSDQCTAFCTQAVHSIQSITVDSNQCNSTYPIAVHWSLVW